MRAGRGRGLALPSLHVVTDDGVLARADFPSRALEVLEAGGERIAFHLRGPGTSGGVLYRLATELREAARAAGALLLVNDRVDVARVLALDGVHLGERSLGVSEAREVLGPGPLVGVSVHGLDAARRAEEAGADYLLAGTVFASRSHPGRPPGGPGLVAGITAAVRLPVVAIGGVTPERVEELVGCGGHGVAVLSGVWDAPSAAAAVARYLAALAKTGHPDAAR